MKRNRGNYYKLHDTINNILLRSLTTSGFLYLIKHIFFDVTKLLLITYANPTRPPLNTQLHVTCYINFDNLSARFIYSDLRKTEQNKDPNRQL